jgi:protocadherin alpha
LVFLLSLIGACYVHGQGGDECNQYLLCDECIAASGDCVWCSDPPPFSGSRCTSSQDAECLSELEDPVAQPPETLKDDPLGETVQISPQEIRLNLRTGKRQTFTLSVKPARNYPLDMFFLMDLSGSQAPDLAMLRNLSNSIIEQLENISSQFHLGFSSFVDKIAYPFASILQNESDYLENHIGNMRIQCANGRDSCDPTYVFRLHLPLTNDETQFREVLEKATIRGNLDAPEATLEALLQTVACRENMGWRNGSLRIVMVLTDAGFKTALDGKVATLLTRNDGRCHLETTPNEDGFYEYFRSPEQDFPSIYQVREKIIENDIITIFAIAKNITDEVSEEDIYELLAEELGSSRSFVQTIRNDSSDIVSVIREAYESITRDIVVESVSGLTIVEINPVLNCSLTVDGMGCANVAIEQLVRFNVTVVMESCLSETTTVLSLPGFGNVDLTLVPICECNCTSQEESPRHKDCSSEGSLSCGICNCVEGRYGEQCECNEPLGPCPDNCFNRGTCDECMRVCTSCDTEEVEVDGVVQILGSYGERCECDNETSGACPSGMGSVCSGRGACECSSEDGCGCRCECEVAPLSGLPYSGPDCSCDPDNCHNSQFPNRLCAHTQGEDRDGECECGECQCEKDFVSYNRTCRHNDDLCAMFEECARCWPMNCTRGDCHPSSLDDIDMCIPDLFPAAGVKESPA